MTIYRTNRGLKVSFKGLSFEARANELMEFLESRGYSSEELDLGISEMYKLRHKSAHFGIFGNFVYTS